MEARVGGQFRVERSGQQVLLAHQHRRTPAFSQHLNSRPNPFNDGRADKDHLQ